MKERIYVHGAVGFTKTVCGINFSTTVPCRMTNVTKDVTCPDCSIILKIWKKNENRSDNSMQEHTVKNFKKDGINVSNACDVLNLKDFTVKLQNRINALSELLEQEVKKRKELEEMYKVLRLCYESHVENNESDFEGLRTSLKMHRNDINAHKE